MTQWLKQHMMPCFYKTYFGIECPGCGFQRAFILLMEGNIFESIEMYPPLLPILILLLFMAAQLVFKFKNGADYLKYWFIFTTVIIIINYIHKQIILFN